MSIKLLAPQLANQIAAGEVVERPASVVKELIENSIDAGASRIDVEIEKGGHKRIRIRDNGSGISKDELELALSRHATSKISSLDDLESILSLGFRGEALASISSVSRLTLTSRPEGQSEAWQAHCEGRDMAVKLNPVAHPQGTSIDVADLFYNTPARRKFLRTEKTEFQHIDDVVKRIALSHPEVAFTLKHNDKMIRRYPVGADAGRENRIAAVAGKKFVDNAIYTQVDYDGICLEAWLGNENVLRSSTDCQFSFVNGRGMRDKLILHAIRQAYESAWGIVEQPAFVVYLTVSPRDVDVNVHPAKHEVRFQQSRLVHDFICKSVLDALSDIPDDATATVTRRHTPEHDYIRPLQHAQQTSAPAVNDLRASSRTGYTGTQGGLTSKGRGGSLAGASAGYQALMTPSSTTSDEQQWVSNASVALSSSCRLYVNGDTSHLLTVNALASRWLISCFESASTSQPLLMPVSVEATTLDDVHLTYLQKRHFQLQQVAGKVRLQQVPAGTRHFPWSSWLGHMLELEITNDENFTRVVDRLALHLPDGLRNEVWHWFDHQPDGQQWEWIREFGKVQPVSTLIEFYN